MHKLGTVGCRGVMLAHWGQLKTEDTHRRWLNEGRSILRRRNSTSKGQEV